MSGLLYDAMANEMDNLGDCGLLRYIMVELE